MDQKKAISQAFLDGERTGRLHTKFTWLDVNRFYYWDGVLKLYPLENPNLTLSTVYLKYKYINLY